MTRQNMGCAEVMESHTALRGKKKFASNPGKIKAGQPRIARSKRIRELASRGVWQKTSTNKPASTSSTHVYERLEATEKNNRKEKRKAKLN